METPRPTFDNADLQSAQVATVSRTSSPPPLDAFNPPVVAEYWCHTQVRVTKLRYIWTISNFSFCREELGEVVKSSMFSSGPNDKLKWCLRINPKGLDEESREYLSLYLLLVNCGTKSEARAKFKFSILNSKREETKAMESQRAYRFVQGKDWGFKKFIRRDVLMDEASGLLPNDRLTLVCEISVVGETQSDSGQINNQQISVPDCRLHEDIGALLFKQVLTDVTLVVMSSKPSSQSPTCSQSPSSSPSIGSCVCSCSNASPAPGHCFQSSSSSVDVIKVHRKDVPAIDSDSESVDDISQKTALNLLHLTDDQDSQIDMPVSDGDALTPVAEQSADSFEEAVSQETGYYDSDGVSSLRSRFPHVSTRMQLATTGGQNEALSTADGDEATAAVHVSAPFESIRQQHPSGGGVVSQDLAKPTASSSGQVMPIGKRMNHPNSPSRHALAYLDDSHSLSCDPSSENGLTPPCHNLVSTTAIPPPASHFNTSSGWSNNLVSSNHNVVAASAISYNNHHHQSVIVGSTSGGTPTHIRSSTTNVVQANNSLEETTTLTLRRGSSQANKATSHDKNQSRRGAVATTPRGACSTTTPTMDSLTLSSNPRSSCPVCTGGGGDGGVALRQFSAHKAILAARSPVFAAMFEHGMEESRANRVQISDIEPDILAEVLRFIYTGQVVGVDRIAQELLAAADKYQLERLKAMCEEALVDSLTVETACDILSLADVHSAEQLKFHTLDFIMLHAQEVCESEGYDRLVRQRPHLLNECFRTLACQQLPLRCWSRKRPRPS